MLVYVYNNFNNVIKVTSTFVMMTDVECTFVTISQHICHRPHQWKVKWQYLSRRRVVFVINMSYSVSLRCHKPLSYFIMTLCLHNLENFYILILFGYPLMFEHLTFFSCRNIFQCKRQESKKCRPVSRI